jgi:hypothetical protein
MMADVNYGAPVEYFADFEDNVGSAADPTSVLFQLTSPTGRQVRRYKGQLSNPSTGRYETTVTMDEVGTWQWLWHGEGAVAAQDNGVIEVGGVKP